MLTDVVADANVIAHAQNESAGENYGRGQRFLVAFIEGATKLALDQSRHVFDEYVDLGLTTSDHELVAAFMREMAERNVILDLSEVDPETRAHIVQLVSAEHADDRILLRLAAVSLSGVLASHDEAAFPRIRRPNVSALCGLSVVDGGECADLISAPHPEA